MNFLLRSVFLLLSTLLLVRSVLADVAFVTPGAGSSYAGGSSISISWQDSGNAPLLSQLTNYVINLCAGGNEAGSFQCSLGVVVAGGAFSDGDAATGMIGAGWGQDMSNGYFLQIVSTSSTGSQVINYSPRFSLISMTGTLPASIVGAISSLPAGTTTGPASSTLDTDTPQAAGADGTVEYANSYEIPYTLQTGPTRYAPMQPIPGTKITATAASMLHPTSSVVLATTYLPSATQYQTTVTQSQTFSVSSIENPASAASSPVPPADPMEKWLNRWKD